MSTAAYRYAQAMAVTERARGRAEEERAWLDLLILLDATAPAPSAATARHERAVAYADDVAEGGAPVPDDYERHYCTDDGEDWPCGAARAARAALAAALPLLTAAPSVVSDAAGLGDRIATLSARLAAVGFPACMCHPGDDDSERCLPSPQDWRAEIERAALSSTTLTATPSATREAVEAVIFEADDERVLEVHEVRSLASRLLARFTITPKEDR